MGCYNGTSVYVCCGDFLKCGSDTKGYANKILSPFWRIMYSLAHCRPVHYVLAIVLTGMVNEVESPLELALMNI